MSFITSALAFLFALTILIAIHEFGHFWVARKMGVKVLRFSIGFGKPLLKYMSKSGTEYVLAWIPLGGYVKMLDEREGDVSDDERHMAFTQKSVYARFAIVAAGPAFNLLFAVAAYWVIAVIGVAGYKPLIGDVTQDSAAAVAGFQAGDEVTGVAGGAVATWGSVRFAMLKGVMDGGSLAFEVDRDGKKVDLQLDMTDGAGVLQGGQLASALGLSMQGLDYPPRIDQVTAGARGEMGGLKTGDLILSADGQPVKTWHDWVLLIQASPEKSISVELDRDGVIITTDVTPALFEAKCRTYGKIGVSPQFEQKWVDAIRSEEIYGAGAGIGVALDKTWNMSILMLKMMGKIVIGEASVKNISGPIMIAQVAGKTASIGVVSFITFLAIISISLGVLNLLPIPLLDGGHLFFYLFEIVLRKPVSDTIQVWGQKVGLVILFLMMSIALYQDVNRLFEGCENVSAQQDNK
ncbi:MAG: RIP metalloprotease RseP, partial [Methylococcales bacterium]|nr:RIP metalloprotease RseP [Methylococcales bacterium]